ncbi:replication protein P [Pseudomonas xionganensis]|uniref:Replication P family protein n=1 Tax=Pseudomonas xionganensis TaxID=2654845 RepID=A0A6I4L036_9PSED|nr:replication protein P [Pseudomonas xionganensis]MVW75373.1 replication P family protein [Pseudomonas xionganensis]
MNGPRNAAQVAANLKPRAIPGAPAPQQVVVDEATQTALADLMRRLKGNYTGWRQAWPTEQEEFAWQDEFLGECLRSGVLSQGLIDHGMRTAGRDRRPFPPTPGEFVSWCLAPDAFGLPSEDAAYRVAMRNTHPAQAGMARWPHASVYHAAVACGYLALQNLERKLGFKLFAEKYLEQRRRMARGEELAPAPIAALPERAGPCTPEVGRAALASLRAKLGRRA